MLKEWKRVWEARKWMKKNEGFLPTWHAYIGYKMNLFEDLEEGKTISELYLSADLDKKLVISWVDVGLVVGHLHIDKERKVYATKQMSKYFSTASNDSIGELLTEMMELHIPTLLNYPDLMKNQQNHTISYNDDYGTTVAETSAMIEKLAFPKLKKWIKKSKANSILDIGCGHAGYLIRLSKAYKRKNFIGIDLNTKVIERAKEKIQEENVNNTNVYQIDITNWKQSEQSFDHIMMNNLLHYFTPEEREEIFKLTYDNLEDNGTLTIISPLYLAKSGKQFSTAFNSFMTAHENLHPIPSENELRMYAENTGYKVERIEPVVKEGSWYFIGLKKVG